jgi:uncharacterized membrane protein YhaH (DUF805 family)
MDPKNPYRSPTSDLTRPVAGVDNTSPFDPSGRFGRLSWLAWNLVVGIAFAVVVFGLMAAGLIAMPSPEAAAESSLTAGMGVGILILDIVMVVVAVLFTIRRFHDFDASGWWSALLIVPLVNFAVFLVLAFKRGTDDANRFGPPRPTPGWEKAFGIAYIVLMVIGLIGMIAAIAIPAYVGYQQQVGIQ